MADAVGSPRQGMLPAIVLAGGAGTRLSTVVSDVPKPMAPINGRPFLEILLGHLIGQGVIAIVLAVGHKFEVIQRHFGSSWRGAAIRYCIEDQPLGTGGALKQALAEAEYARAFALKGDSYCAVDLQSLQAAHRDAALTLALKRVDDVGRFGAVEIDADARIVAFREKSIAAGSGLINAGVYLLERSLFRCAPPSPRFSFETDIMQRHFSSVVMRGMITDAAFIDIGLPEEFQRAQAVLK